MVFEARLEGNAVIWISDYDAGVTPRDERLVMEGAGTTVGWNVSIYQLGMFELWRGSTKSTSGAGDRGLHPAGAHPNRPSSGQLEAPRILIAKMRLSPGLIPALG